MRVKENIAQAKCRSKILLDNDDALSSSSNEEVKETVVLNGHATENGTKKVAGKASVNYFSSETQEDSG